MFLLIALLGTAGELQGAERPNIVYILADDLGYGDVHCLNPDGKIPTPNIDRLAAGGMVFTDAHSSSAVCTPTRYGILTGRYNWRSRLKSGVLYGYSRRLIEPGRLTVAEFLKQQGYATACVGKWHLGMDWPLKSGGFAERDADGWKVDYSRPVKNGPTTLGFDRFFGISASLDMPPYVFINNDRVTEQPTVEKQWIRKGPAAAVFEAIDVLPALTREAVASIDRQAPASAGGKPFFLYLALSAPHTPILPTAQWQGRTKLNAYADFVAQVDGAVGQVLDALDHRGLSKNTLVIATSDNGCSPEAKFPELLARGHNPSAQFRGHKADLFEGGHRIPFIARWPARIKAGSKCDQLICLNDLFATCAEILGAKLPADAAEDSVSILPALGGRAGKPLREALVHHSINGSFAVRSGRWKLLLAPDSGGWSAPVPGAPDARGLPSVQLYDLASDSGETKNVQDWHPEVVARLRALLERYVADGRSTPGPPQSNHGRVEIFPRANAQPR
jgi:arylsulfatase A-like enzyme